MVSNVIMAVAIVLAASTSALLWRNARLLFVRVSESWPRFVTLSLGVFGLVYGLFFSANHLLRYSSTNDGGAIDIVLFVWFPLIATLATVGIGRVIATRSNSNERAEVLGGGLAVLGVLTALFLRSAYVPSLSVLPLIICTVVGAVLGIGVALLSNGNRSVGVMLGTAGGFAVGAWGFAGSGAGSTAWAVIAMIIPLALSGVALARVSKPQTPVTDDTRFGAMSTVPGLLFVVLWVLIPLVRALKGTESGDKVLKTLIVVVIAVAGSAGIWVGANLFFNQVRRSWSLFTTLALAFGGFAFGILLSGNRILRFSSTERGTTIKNLELLLWFPIVAAIIAAVVGIVLGRTTDRTVRTVVGGVGIGALGVLAGALTRSEYFPALEPVALVLSTAIGAGVFAALATARRRATIRGALFGAAFGWVFGAWAIPTLGTGSQIWAIVAMTVPATLIGAAIGWSPAPSHARRDEIDQTSRAFTFVGPAFFFIVVALVAPAIRTILLSMQDKKGEKWIWFQNYRSVLGRRDTLDLTNWSAIFTSRLFWIAAVLAVVTVVLGVMGKVRSGKFVELGGASSFPMLGAFILGAFAAFSVLRGTLINNLWWVVVVVVFSTSLGLMVAVLADGRSGEKIAKSLIFVPVALSLVGASVIWRFMYVARDPSIPQTGVMNALWVGLGRLSTGNGIPTYVFGAIVTAVLVALIIITVRALLRSQYATAAVPGIGAVLMLWFTIRYWMPGGVGGVIPLGDGQYKSDTIFFIQTAPFNNFWLMVVLIWIQTGFAMVILSAAIQSVPVELLEAARVDGATPSQVFWRVTLPQIATTIGVVVTTLIVLVMKVYDIVKVMTNGNFGTQVLANDMFNTAFQVGNFGEGAALAVLILVLVLPVMIYNIHNMQKEA